MAVCWWVRSRLSTCAACAKPVEHPPLCYDCWSVVWARKGLIEQTQALEARGVASGIPLPEVRRRLHHALFAPSWKAVKRDMEEL